MMDAQSQFFQQGHQSLSELDDYRRTLSEEVTRTCEGMRGRAGDKCVGGTKFIDGGRDLFKYVVQILKLGNTARESGVKNSL
jgi:hypothetical protein